MGPGETVTDKRQLAASDLGLDAAVTVHVLQHQPTSRPIEDRYSIDVRARATSASNVGETTLLLGVYDGHRGSSAAEHVAQSLPSELLLTAALKSQPSAATILETFDALDKQMLSSFQDAHPAPPTAVLAPAPRRFLGSIAAKFFKPKPHEIIPIKEPEIKPENTTAALRVLSGCTASMLMIKLPHDQAKGLSVEAINLGDSRAVIASFNPDPKIYFASVDVNSGVEEEQSLVASQHPGDDAKDIFVGGRLFGETLSTRGFGDGIYKLPLKSSQSSPTNRQSITDKPSAYPEMTMTQKSQHKHLIQQLSAHQQSVAASNDKKIIPLIDRYDALFSAYRSPPYVSAIPQVTEVSLDVPTSGEEGEDASAQKETKSTMAILATDGLWDLISSEEAANILGQALKETEDDSSMEQVNLAQILFDKVIDRAGRKPGDDVTILVLALPQKNT